MKQRILSFTGTSSGPQDYEEYTLSKAELTTGLVKGSGIILLFAYIFYRSALFAVLASPLLIFYLKRERKLCIVKRKDNLTLQFREMMYSVIAGLQAGYSIENCFRRALEDMLLLYGKNSLICTELVYINRELRNNKNIEDVLDAFAVRAHVQDISDFSEVFRIAKRSGGDMPSILKNTADLISDKIEVRREINTQISAKKMEQGIMNLVPFGIIFYIDATSPGFFDPLYHNVTGVALMSAMMAVYLGAYILGEKILNISY